MRSSARGTWRRVAPVLWAGCLLAGGAVLLGSRPGEGGGTDPAGDREPVSFGRDIRPILVKSCLACHGFDPSTREAELRLDIFEGATADRGAMGPAAIVPGNPDASPLIARVTSEDPDVRMPAEGEALNETQVGLLRRWIAEGASYEKHWSLRPVTMVEAPVVEDSAWSSPIDAFVRAKLDEAGLEPAGPADRRTLIRRLTFDLTGMAPTPERVRAFEADDSEGAQARLVDELLASPRYGERWGRHWLDLMRYAETYAHEFDYPIRHAWQYRDYVIRAFNQDVAYDQLVREHLAGDLLEPARRNTAEGYDESIIGTGWWWLSQGTHGPVDVLQDEADRIDNQIDVMCKSFLASTVSCARCHDHKFDPVLTREYYALAGFVQSSRRQEAYLDPGGKIARAATQMASAQEEARARLEAVVAPALRGEAVDEYLLATEEVLFGEAKEGEAPASARDVVIDSFDDLTYGAWTVEGDAFTDRPTEAGEDALAGNGTARGAGFANTHRRLDGEGSVEADLRVGKLIGAPFTIDHDYLHFLIGGGSHPGKTGLRLVVDGETVREETGINSLSLVARSFELADLRGREGHIEIFDEETGGWGNIRVDEIGLSDEPSAALPAARSIEAVSAERGLDADRLEAWVRLVQGAGEDDPLGPWAAAIRAAGADSAADVSEAVRVGDEAGVEREVFADFDDARAFDDWFVNGWAFGDAPVAPGAWVSTATGARLSEVGAADSGRYSASLMGTMRSGTFEITSPYIAVRARGRGVVRVIIDGYTLDEYNALLFERCRLEVNSEDWSWNVHDVHRYVGHRAHYEIIDDSMDSSLAVDRIEFVGEDRAPADGGWGREIAGRIDGDVTAAAIAEVYAGAVRRAMDGEDDELGLALVGELLPGVLGTTTDTALAGARGRLAALRLDCPAPMRVMAMEDGTGEDQHVYIRGSHKTLGEVASRGFIGVMCDDPTLAIESGSGRLELAEKLLDESDPLVARVIVNRVWEHLMGRGIVATPDDFGLLGREPTHPELLDHLAYRFRHEMGWSIKTLIREIVMSRTYRMASGALSERAEEIDPENTLWSVRTPKRLEGEAIRDSILEVSGGLNGEMYGPSVPVHLSEFLTGRGRPSTSGPVDGEGRRSIYLEVRRNFLNPMMQTFDQPNPHSTIGKRSVSNVPAQSLILLNAPFVVEQAGKLADRVMAEAQTPEGRLDRLYWLALSRGATESERAAAFEFLEAQASDRGVADWREDRSGWADLAHVMFNLKEFVFIE